MLIGMYMRIKVVLKKAIKIDLILKPLLEVIALLDRK